MPAHGPHLVVSAEDPSPAPIGQGAASIRVKRKDGERWRTPRVSCHQAMEQAGLMVDRFNRMYLGSLRMLQDLRRSCPRVVVQQAGQVNVANHDLTATVPIVERNAAE